MRTSASRIVTYSSDYKKRLAFSTSAFPSNHLQKKLGRVKPSSQNHYDVILSSGHNASAVTANGSLYTAQHFSTYSESQNDDDITQTIDTSPKKFLTTREEKVKKTNELLNAVPIGKMTLHDHLRQARYLLHYWANMRTEDGVKKAEELLERVVVEHRDGRNPDAHTNAYTYNFVIDSWAKSGCYDGPLRAESLLNRMEERYSSAIEVGVLSTAEDENLGESTAFYPQPSIEAYNSTLHAWSQSDRPEAISKAEAIISHLEGKEDTMFLPNTRTYNILMNAYANQVGEYGFAQKAEDVLLQMSQLSKNGSLNINPDTLSFNTVLKAWKNSAGGIESAKRAEDILRLMVKLYSEGHENVRPDSISWCTVIYAYGKHFKRHDKESAIMAIDEAESLAEFFMEYSHGLPNYRGVASSIICAIVDCILNSGLPDAGERAKKYLDKVMQNEYSRKVFEDPDLVTFLVRAFADSKDKETGLKAYDILQDMIDEVVGVKPNILLVNKVLRMLARFREEEKAEHIYRTIKDLAENREFDTVPDIITFNTMANMYFRSAHDDSCRKLNDIVQEVEDINSSVGLRSFDTFSHSVLINKLSKSQKRDGAEKAFELLTKMEDHFSNGNKNCVRPDTIMYNMVLAKISKERSYDAGAKAMQIIEQMEKVANEGNSSVTPDTMTYTSGMNAWVKSGSDETNKKVVELLDKMEDLFVDENSAVQLDTIVFETALQGFQRGEREDGEIAERIFERMVTLHRDGNKHIQPSALACNLVLKAHCTTAKRSDRIKSLFDAQAMLLKLVRRYRRREIDFLPDRIGFNTVISSWAKVRHSLALDSSQELYATMQNLCNKGVKDVAPDHYTNAAILTILSKSRSSNAARKAQRFFDKLDPDTLDIVTYNCLLSVWAKSKEKKKLKVVRQILEEMVKRRKVDLISYNIVLNAFCFSHRNDVTNKDTFALALEVYGELATLYTPDDISFKTMIRACKRLSATEEECNRNLKLFFEYCCRNGLVGQILIQELKARFPGKKCEQVLGYSLQDKPIGEWTRNL